LSLFIWLATSTNKYSDSTIELPKTIR